MAGDWIKMRASLCTHPKVLLIAEIVGESTEVGRRLSTGFNGCLDEIVTRDVTRDVTLAALLRVWCATNEHTDDGVWKNSTLRTIDQAAGIPGFGEAMQTAGWAIFDAESRTVEMPNFLENNAPAKDNARSTNAERQARYRQKHRSTRQHDDVETVTSNVTHNVTGDVTVSVTSNAREEKRREEDKDIGARTDVGGETRAPVRPSDLSAAMRRNSIEAQPGDPRIVAAAEAGISVETIEAACAEAKASDTSGRIKAGFVVAIAQRWTADAARPPPSGRSRPQHRSYHDERAETIAALTGRSRRNESDDRVVDVEATRLS
ncbi:hypothetical protein QCE63_32220 [Caballeronia sp. LZ065]|uniref:hypothetical protein n=1 Tax=Caballeronia sp. LZ065 TaxID=3038571 RepID=UPI002866F9A6|nr:hypothetical protein [Caballeronia sp. LZ065]MDR5784088.1 hypothetical protein [Caballeronia sp. LZ065]